MTTNNRVAELNEFKKNAQGVFSADEDGSDFNYSDGQASEKALYDILSEAKDLSSDSQELQDKITDWPTEYHLSTTRANLLRALNLSGVKRVLELGCGCGSITRYLGEQTDIEVDAVEGSKTRAALAKLRCVELENVQISSANFNDIELPTAEYDLVLFVGVTEYAGRFSSANSDQEALQELLAMGKRAAKADGVVLVAIENRLGLKYALGANEDHYALPYVGIQNYPQADGIRTYSKAEWLEQISAANFSQSELLLPFPDYKVPTRVVHESLEPEKVLELLRGCASRDYAQQFSIHNEPQVWSALAQSQSLAEHSNSFLWLLGNDAERISEVSSVATGMFDKPKRNYETFPPEPVTMRVEDAKVIEHLNAQITQLESHSKNLEDKVNLMSNSVGWKFLNGVRRLFRKTTL